jgi:hypothetical protein
MNPQSTPRNLAHVALLGIAVFLIPSLLGLLFVQCYQKLAVPRAPSADGFVALTNRLADASVTDLDALFLLRRDARSEGLATEELDLRIWAAQAVHPAALFRVSPPAGGEQWNWHLSQDGRFAVAVSVGFDAAERRQIGLYDLIADRWVWTNKLPWPDTHEAPYVFDRHLVLRYVKNAARFALEVNPEGRILSIDKLGKGSFAFPPPPPADPACPGTPVAVKGRVFFVTDPDRQDLVGYAQERLPGLRYAGTGDANTLFSGNGRLKFTIREGAVTVCDSLTQTVLQKLAVWKPATNITVTGALTTRDGASLNVFLKADFGGTPAVTREWSVSVATYTGTVLPSFNADALLAKPRRLNQTQAVSLDNRWQLTVTASNDLSIATYPETREIARVALGPPLGLSGPIDHLAVLENGRIAVLRQGSNFWLLDFAAARTYAGLLSRLTATAEAAAHQAAKPVETNLPPAVVEMTLGEDSYFEPEPWPDLPPPAPYALRAERCAAHQAWPYVASLLELCAEYSDFDGRAPRVNPLLQARAELLAGENEKARLICRRALYELITDPSNYSRMIRYQLQGILFSLP